MTATQRGASAMIFCSVLATSDSEAERPSAHRVRRISDQREHAFVADSLQTRGIVRAADDRRRIELPVAGMEDGTAGVRIARPFGSGIECVTLTNSTSNGPALKRPLSGTSLIGSESAPPIFAELRLQHPAVNGVAKIGHSSDGQRSMMAPTWSSCACVRTRPDEVFALRDDEAEVGQA